MRRCFAATLAAGILLSGCGGSSGGRIVRTAASANKTRHGELVQAPTPLSVNDIAKEPSNSPQQALLSLVFYGQWGSPPNIAAMFDQRATRAVGADNIAGAWITNRTALLSETPVIVGVRMTSAGALVVVDLLSQNSPPQHESFQFVRVKGRWRVLYDTLTESWIGPYVQVARQDQIDPTATATDKRAVAAGIRAAHVFLRVSLSR